MGLNGGLFRAAPQFFWGYQIIAYEIGIPPSRSDAASGR